MMTDFLVRKVPNPLDLDTGAVIAPGGHCSFTDGDYYE